MGRTNFIAPQRNDPFNTGDSVEFGVTPTDLVNALNTMSSELYSAALPNPNMRGYRAKLNQLRAGKLARNLKIGIYSSSVGAGVDETSNPYNTQYQNSYGHWLAKVLADAGYAASAEAIFGLRGPSVADTQNRDSRITTTGTVSSGSGSVPGGTGFVMSSAGTLKIQSLGNCDTCDVYFRDATVGRQVSYVVDAAGNSGNISTANTNTYAMQSIALGALATHYITFTWVSGGFEIDAIEFRDSTTNKISIWNQSCAGFEAASFVSENGAPLGGRLTFGNKYPVDLAITDFALTNSWRNSRLLSDTQANVATMLNHWSGMGAPVIFIPPPFDGGNTGYTVQQETFVAAVKAQVIAAGQTVADWRSSSVSYTAASGAGIMGDNTHLTAANGAVDVARYLKPYLVV